MMEDLQGRYSVILADPPWQFATFSKKGQGRCASAHYDCMRFDDLRRLPVSRYAARDCVLLLWTTDPMLARALDLMRSWGFTYKTVGFTWAKTNRRVKGPPYREQDFFKGMGYWTRANAELCLLGTVGHPKRIGTSVDRLMVSPRREHSRKPDEVYSRIEQLLDGPYLELFARRRSPGWTAWGDQVDLFQHGAVQTRRFPSSSMVSLAS